MSSFFTPFPVIDRTLVGTSNPMSRLRPLPLIISVFARSAGGEGLGF